MCADWGDDEFWREQQASNRKISSFHGECNDNPTFSPWNLKSNVSFLFKKKKKKLMLRITTFILHALKK